MQDLFRDIDHLLKSWVPLLRSFLFWGWGDVIERAGETHFVPEEQNASQSAGQRHDDTISVSAGVIEVVKLSALLVHHAKAVLLCKFPGQGFDDCPRLCFADYGVPDHSLYNRGSVLRVSCFGLVSAYEDAND
jgi:hypothetical protein